MMCDVMPTISEDGMDHALMQQQSPNNVVAVSGATTSDQPDSNSTEGTGRHKLYADTVLLYSLAGNLE